MTRIHHDLGRVDRKRRACHVRDHRPAEATALERQRQRADRPLCRAACRRPPGVGSRRHRAAAGARHVSRRTRVSAEGRASPETRSCAHRANRLPRWSRHSRLRHVGRTRPHPRPRRSRAAGLARLPSYRRRRTLPHELGCAGQRGRRYFGPLPRRSVIGRALPVWTDEAGDGRFVWRADTR